LAIFSHASAVTGDGARSASLSHSIAFWRQSSAWDKGIRDFRNNPPKARIVPVAHVEFYLAAAIELR
jgi:hypothetical protein